MTELGVVYRSIKRADRGATDALAAFGAATVHEAMGRVGLMKPYMRPIYAGAQVSGTAVTVLLHPGDNCANIFIRTMVDGLVVEARKLGGKAASWRPVGMTSWRGSRVCIRRCT
jgi:regulator of RNase E activity RraA